MTCVCASRSERSGPSDVPRALLPRPLHPRRLPDQVATGLTPAVTLPVATEALQQQGMPDAAQPRAVGVLPDLVDPPEHHKPLSAVRHHLRHEGQSVQTAALVERREDLGEAPNLHQISGSRRRPGVDRTTQRRPCPPSHALAGPNGTVGQPTLLAGVSREDGDATCGDERSDHAHRHECDRHERTNGSHDPCRQQAVAGAPSGGESDRTRRDERADRGARGADRRTEEAAAMRTELHSR